MKPIYFFFVLLFTTFGYAQNTGMIVGKVMDQELENSPLVFANITIKETSLVSQTDLTGLFLIENLEAGDYTLVCSFPGYETQEIKVHIDPVQPTELQVSLAASTLSLSELTSLTSTSVSQKSDDKTLTVLK